MTSDLVGHVVFAVVMLALLVGSVTALRHTGARRHAGGTERLLWVAAILVTSCVSLLLVLTFVQTLQPAQS